MKNTFSNFDEYFLLCPEEVQMKLDVLREFVHRQSSEFEEYIGYQMPGFKYKTKPLVYFAAFYPMAKAIQCFENHFIERNYKYSKGAVQFPLKEDLPLDLIAEMVKFRMKEIDEVE